MSTMNLLMLNNEEVTATQVLDMCEKVWGERRVPPEYKYKPGFKYYAVQVQFGHLGHHKSYIRNRYMRDTNLLNAIKHAKRMPRAKKHRYDVVPKAREISYKEYLIGKLDELQDPYLRLDPKRGEKFDKNKPMCWVN